MAARYERKYMAHFLDTSFKWQPGYSGSITHKWYRLGKDLSEYSIEMNPDIERVQNFRGEDIIIHNGYEMSAEADSFYGYPSDALLSKLQTFADSGKTGAGLYTLALEVRLWETATVSGSTGYRGVMRPVYVVPESYGGDTSGYQIPFNVHYLNTETTEGTFVPDGEGSGTFYED